MWKYIGDRRPPFALEPGPGQQSVWDYPRPPRIEEDTRLVEVYTQGRPVAASARCIRVLETAGPPTFYLPTDDVDVSLLVRAPGTSLCEWKGEAAYWTVRLDGTSIAAAAWSYPSPKPAFARISRYFSFYPGRVDCRVGGERVRPQPGGFYGGWVTDEIVGPIKGEPGSESW